MMINERLPMIFSTVRARISRLAKTSRFMTFAAASALLLGIAAPAALTSAPAFAQGANDAAAAQKIADHFSSVRTMTGEFVQFGPRGEQSGGTFYIERPGKIRFNYNNSPIRVISDGNQVVINNRKLDTWDLYALSTTPLNLLLADRINLGGGRLKSVKQEPDVITL